MDFDSLWELSTEFPGELNQDGQGHSVDVLIYNLDTQEHTIGWYDFNIMSWKFLNNEGQLNFKWRYFIENLDFPNEKD